jgi:hypothetical protein
VIWSEASCVKFCGVEGRGWGEGWSVNLLVGWSLGSCTTYSAVWICLVKIIEPV